MDKGDLVAVIQLDFQNSFDKVSHQGLLNKLSRHWIKEQVFLWMENWLVNRKQRLSIKGQFSQ